MRKQLELRGFSQETLTADERKLGSSQYGVGI